MVIIESSLLITGVFDGDLTGGLPKIIELYVIKDIADLSLFGVGSANNGGGTDGPEFYFPKGTSASAGEFIYLIRDRSGGGEEEKKGTRRNIQGVFQFFVRR